MMVYPFPFISWPLKFLTWLHFDSWVHLLSSRCVTPKFNQYCILHCNPGILKNDCSPRFSFFPQRVGWEHCLECTDSYGGTADPVVCRQQTWRCPSDGSLCCFFNMSPLPLGAIVATQSPESYSNSSECLQQSECLWFPWFSSDVSRI